MPMHNPPHPGEALREDVLPALGMTEAEFSIHLGYSVGRLAAVLNGWMLEGENLEAWRRAWLPD